MFLDSVLISRPIKKNPEYAGALDLDLSKVLRIEYTVSDA